MEQILLGKITLKNPNNDTTGFEYIFRICILNILLHGLTMQCTNI